MAIIVTVVALSIATTLALKPNIEIDKNMSNWLSSVNNLLEKLDDTAETVAERRQLGDETVSDGEGDIGDILAKRGLDYTDQEETIEVEHAKATDVEKPPSNHQEESKGNESSNLTAANDNAKTESEQIDPESDTKTKAKVDSEEEIKITKKTHLSKAPPPASPVRTGPKSQKERELVMEAKEAQKESRTLRRHVVSLNAQLEAAESEIQAQRNELEQAAEQMDRMRTKEAKESVKKLHTQELTALKEHNAKALKEQQKRFEDQLETYRNKLTEVESQRKQEDGDWSKEMTNVIEREQEVNSRLILLE